MAAPATSMLAVALVFAALFGLAFGSFLTVVVARVPEGRSIVRPGSACPACGTCLAWPDNVPVLSWLLLRGRCRHCGAGISARYPAIESATAAVFVLAAWWAVGAPGLPATSGGLGTVLPALVCAVLGSGAGALVPWLIARIPEPAQEESSEDTGLPAKIAYAEAARTPGLGWRCVVACALAGGLLGAVLGWSWALSWLLPLVPVGCALAVVDLRTWYLPTRLVLPSYAVAALAIAVAAGAGGRPEILLHAVLGWLALGLGYGALWFASPRLLGYGDVRLAGLLGMALGPLGPEAVALSVPAAAVGGLLAFLPLRLTGHALANRLPFGPFLLLGAYASVLATALLGYSPTLAG